MDVVLDIHYTFATMYIDWKIQIFSAVLHIEKKTYRDKISLKYEVK